MVNMKRALSNQVINGIRLQVKFASLVVSSIVLLAFSVSASAQEIRAVQLYSQDELINLINANEHLDRVVLDRLSLIHI